MQRLIVNPDLDNAWEISLQTGIATLGRGPENDWVIDHPSVSTHHCEFTIEDSSVGIRDLNSTNGTFIDGQSVVEGVLTPGQTLQLGEVRLRFEQVEDPSAAANSPALCKFHPRNSARHRCPKCLGSFCEMCVNTRMVHGQAQTFCRTCGVECKPLAPAAVKKTPKLSFTRQAMSAFQYPVKGDGIILIIAGALFFLSLDAVKWVAKYGGMYGFAAVGFVTIFGTGYLTAYLRRILTATAMGEDKLPKWPDLTDFGSDIASPFWQLVGTVLFCFAPAIGLTIYAASEAGGGDTAWLGWVTTAALVLGCVYFPMAFTAVAMLDSVGAVNPLLVVPSITKVLREYAITVVILGLILAARLGLNMLLETLLPVFLIPTIISGFLGFYLLIVEMRILGLLYRNKKYELGWLT